MRTQRLRRLGASALAALLLATALPASAGDDAEKAGRSVGEAARTAMRTIGHATRDGVKENGHTTRDIVRGSGRGLRGDGKED